MTIQVHGMPLSAPSRIVYMTCEALGLEYEVILCDLMKGDNKTPEYLKVTFPVFNPKSTQMFGMINFEFQ